MTKDERIQALKFILLSHGLSMALAMTLATAIEEAIGVNKEILMPLWRENTKFGTNYPGKFFKAISNNREVIKINETPILQKHQTPSK